eukprot:GDKI01044171.1.p2 GENE.GDKI01044171.1~~GDKI01044171.1.p2  ORF type:complete len:148 (+),score=12.52 GDKI01044171.1:441-884(+)
MHVVKARPTPHTKAALDHMNSTVQLCSRTASVLFIMSTAKRYARSASTVCCSPPIPASVPAAVCVTGASICCTSFFLPCRPADSSAHSVSVFSTKSSVSAYACILLYSGASASLSPSPSHNTQLASFTYHIYQNSPRNHPVPHTSPP